MKESLLPEQPMFDIGKMPARLLIITVGFLFGFWISPVYSETRVQIEFAENISQFSDGRILAKKLRTRFDCGERIYGVFRLENLENGTRRIQTQWVSPGGKVEKTNKRTIPVSSPQQIVFLSSSIEFASGNTLSSIIDPAAGFEPYIGRWTVNVIVDNKTIDSDSFQVLC